MTMTELERQHAHYRAIRERLWAKRPAPKAQTATTIKTIPVRPWEPERPLWKQSEIRFDAHVLEYWAWQVDQVSPKRAYIRRRAAELGVTYDEVIGEGRFRAVVAARHLIAWEVKKIWPQATWPELGRIFGDRDHTTLLLCFRKMEAKMRCDL